MRRITITLLLVVLASIFGLGLALDVLFERYSSNSDDVVDQIQYFAAGYANMLNDSERPEKIVQNWPEKTDVDVSVDSVDNLALPEPLRSEFQSGDGIVLETDADVSLHYYLPQHEKVLSIKTNLSQLNNNTALVFTVLFYLGTLLLVLVWLRPLLSRLSKLRHTAQDFGAGNLNSRVPASGLSYIRDIERDFNRMATQIQQLISDNKLLTAAVSHDLRTPLARLRFGIETLEESKDPATSRRYHKRIRSDLDEMEQLVNSLLSYARLDNVLEGIKKDPVSLRKLLPECAAQFYDAGISISIDDGNIPRDDALVLQGSIEHLATLFNNLVKNAVEHARSKLIIRLVKKSETDPIEVSFCDDGPGIPEHLQNDVLKPFRRGGNQSYQGYGLGLAVVERIANHHRGVVKIQRCVELGGAAITVSFE